MGLFVDARLAPAIFAIDALIAALALADLVTLLGASRLKAERSFGAVASLGEAEDVELTVENLSPAPRRLRIRDDVPFTCRAEPAEFNVRIPAAQPRGVALQDHSVAARVVSDASRRRSRFQPAWVLAKSGAGALRIAGCASIRTSARSARYTVLARRDKLSTLGVRRSRKLGTDNEFERLRDYAEGDEPRDMDWRATAKRRKLTVRAAIRSTSRNG